MEYSVFAPVVKSCKRPSRCFYFSPFFSGETDAIEVGVAASIAVLLAAPGSQEEIHLPVVCPGSPEKLLASFNHSAR
jgi:hypothetical protein